MTIKWAPYFSLLLAINSTANPIAQVQPASSVAQPAIAKPAPLPQISLLVAAFRPFKKSETNMAQMVAEEMNDLVRTMPEFNNIRLDRVDLDVVYYKSAEQFAQKARSIQTPDVIIGLGQGDSVRGVTLETGADSNPSNILDMNSRNRPANLYPGLKEKIGFNFPAQDMYCSLPANERKKVLVSYKGGNFVCNDFSFNVAHFTRAESDIAKWQKNFIANINSQYDNDVASISGNMSFQIEEAKKEYQRIYAEEAPARAQHEANIADIQRRNAARKQQIDMAFPAQRQACLDRVAAESQPRTVLTQDGSVVRIHSGASAYGPQDTSPSYSSNFNSNYNSSYNSAVSNQRQSKEVCPTAPVYLGMEFEPQFPTKAIDRTKEIKYAADSQINQLKQNRDSLIKRVNELASLYGVDKSSRFQFIHVPASDGIQYQPKYNLIDAVCSKQSLSGNDWYAEYQAENLLDSSVSAIRSKAKSIIAQKFKAAEKDPNVYVDSSHPNVCDLPSGPTYTVEEKDFTGNTRTRKVTPPPSGRYYYRLSPYTQKAELREISEARGYAFTILKMLNGALARSKKFQPNDLPLPTFNNAARMPRTEYERDTALAHIKNLAFGYTREYKAQRPGGKPGETEVRFEQVPPMIGADEGECYSDFVRKIGQDQKSDDSKSSLN